MMEYLLRILAAMSVGEVITLEGGAYKTAGAEPRGVPVKISTPCGIGTHGFVVHLDNGEAAYYHPMLAAAEDYISDAEAGRSAKSLGFRPLVGRLGRRI